MTKKEKIMTLLNSTQSHLTDALNECEVIYQDNGRSGYVLIIRNGKRIFDNVGWTNKDRILKQLNDFFPSAVALGRGV